MDPRPFSLLLGCVDSLGWPILGRSGVCDWAWKRLDAVTAEDSKGGGEKRCKKHGKKAAGHPPIQEGRRSDGYASWIHDASPEGARATWQFLSACESVCRKIRG